MRARDNEAKIAAVQVVAWRRLGAAGRMRVAAEMSDDTRRAAVEKLRRSNPDWTEHDAHHAVARGSADRSSGQRAVAASSFALEEALARLIRVFESTCVPFMITGSLASTAHGVPRATGDLDVVIDPSERTLEELLGALESGGWTVDHGAACHGLDVRGSFVVVDDATAWKADLFVRRDRPFSIAEFERREAMDVLGLRAWVASPEDTILAKLESARDADNVVRRTQQRRDAMHVIASRGPDLDRAYVEKWVEALDLDEEWDGLQ